MKYAVVKEISEAKTPNGNVEMFRYAVKELKCSEYGNYEAGKVATVVKGRKIPKGTEVTILRWVEDSYGRSYRSYYYNNLYNPAVLVQLPDGNNVWTIAENLELAPEAVDGWVETVEAESKDEACKIVSSKYQNCSGNVYYLDNDGQPKIKGFDCLDCGMSVYSFGKDKYLYDCGDTWACVLDDWRKDIYIFVAFEKTPKVNNVVKYVSTGRAKRWDDNGGDTGLGDAINAYEEYVSNYESIKREVC